jgi:hypothetical protein
METTPLATAFHELTRAAQIEFLVRLAHELTIVGRDAYEPGSLELEHPRRLRCLNEIQHRLLSHVLALLAANPSFSDEALVSTILELDDPVLRQQVTGAFVRSLSAQSGT